MKNLLILVLFLTNFAHGQQVIDPVLFKQEFEQIRKQEMRAFEGAILNGAMDASGYSVASSNFDVHHIRLEWTIDPAVNYIRGACSFDFAITQNTNSITFDLTNQLVVDSVLYHGNAVIFTRTPDHGLVVNFPANINAGSRDSVSIYYQGIPAGSGMGSFYRGAHGGAPIIWTLSEPYGARDWWPCKNGLSDKADSIDIYITCPQAFQPSSNGVLVSNTINGANRTSHFKHRFPIATYLVAMAVSNYIMSDDTVQVGGNIYKWQSFRYPETGNFFTRESFGKVAYQIFSQLFELYPFASEKYGHTQWGWNGGMEHQTNSFVISPSPNLMAHELAHQWFGDMITCNSWQDIWLNEGFATYLTLLYLEIGYPDFFRPLLVSTHNNVVSDSTGSVFVDDTTSVNRIFSGRLTYNKGAYVLHMLRGVLGDSVFIRGVRRYLNDPQVRFKYAVTADLRRNMEAESGKDLSSFFQKWVYGQGYPNYHAEWSQNINNYVKVKLMQSTSHPSVSFYEMPVTLLLRGGSQGASFKVDQQFNGQEFVLNPGFVVDTVIIEPDYWILSKIKTSAKKAASSTVNDIKIYPNPTPGQLYISLNNPGDKKLYLRLYNSVGQLVYTRDMDTPGQDELISIPALGLARGTYLLQIKSEKNINITKKIVH